MRPQRQFWNCNEIWPTQRGYQSHLLIWDGTTGRLWKQRPARLFCPIESELLVDTTPKVGQAFGMIVTVDHFSTLEALYTDAASPQAFMAAVIESYEAGSYSAPFQMSALHVIGELAFLYHLRTTDEYGRLAKKIGFSATGMILQDIAQDWFSESFKTS